MLNRELFILTISILIPRNKALSKILHIPACE
jgi:hypothetical protein